MPCYCVCAQPFCACPWYHTHSTINEWVGGAAFSLTGGVAVGGTFCASACWLCTLGRPWNVSSQLFSRVCRGRTRKPQLETSAPSLSTVSVLVAAVQRAAECLMSADKRWSSSEEKLLHFYFILSTIHNKQAVPYSKCSNSTEKQLLSPSVTIECAPPTSDVLCIGRRFYQHFILQVRFFYSCSRAAGSRGPVVCLIKWFISFSFPCNFRQ